MIEYLGVVYEVAKNLKDYLKWDEEDKLVDLAWVEKSGFGAEANKKGYELRWVKPDRVESLKLDGHEVMYEIDKIRRKRRRIVVRDGLVLVGKTA